MPEQPQLRISGKDLGQLALPGACARCFWLSRQVSRLPYQIFPGIFSSIDSYSKKVVHGYFDRHGRAPPWLADLGDVAGYREPPHHSAFGFVDDEIGVHLTGAPDAVFTRADGSLIIADYKTSRFTVAQERLFPMYAVQLNAYAVIAQQLDWPAVGALALIYTEPVTDADAAHALANQRERGFAMAFSAHIKSVPLAPARVRDLMHRAARICRAERAPRSARGCPECARVLEMVGLLGGDSADAEAGDGE
jgi:hypothetical protein